MREVERRVGIVPPRTAPDGPRRTESFRPWSPEQVRVAESWPGGGEQVSVALSPTGDRVALSVGQRLSVFARAGQRLLQVPCALSPGLAWSPRGDILGYRDDDGKGRLLDLAGATAAEVRPETLGPVSAIAFEPAGDRVATLAPSLPGRMVLTMLGPDLAPAWVCVLTRDRMASHRSEGVSLAWSPDGRLLAGTTGTPAVFLIDAATGLQAGEFAGHSQVVTGLSWIDDERIVSASEDATLQVWHLDAAAAPAGPETADLPAVVEAVVETAAAVGMAYAREQGIALIWSAAGDLFAWSLAGTPAQLWHREPPARSVAAHFTRPAVSAVSGLLALVDPGATELVLVSDWRQTAGGPATSTTYANAKVLLLGDSGVGKSGLALVLAGEDFRPTESTHGRMIWQLPPEPRADAGYGQREVLIWDLAGQPGYRIVHQLHLGGAALALILFDSRSETEPLAGVRHWARAVRHAHPVASGGLTTFLVAARTDRGGITVSRERIQQLVTEFALDEYCETSAREGTGVDLLRSRMLAAIDWDRIPTITSTVLFAAVKRFMRDQRMAGHLMMPLDELSQAFRTQVPSGLELMRAENKIPDLTDADAQEASSAALAAVFEGCVARLESAGQVKRLKLWDYVLLQPELLDSYASAIVNAARDEPDGLGSILESRIVSLDFTVPSADRVTGERQEQLLVFATLEELTRSELVLREPTDDGMQLVFPSAYRRDLPASEAPRGDGVAFRLEGPVDNIYATLIVRLSRSSVFTRVDSWQSAARFAADVGECTVRLRSGGDGEAELLVGYDQVPDLLRLQFERFVHAHLERRATPGTVVRERRYSCPRDNTAFTAEQVAQVRRLDRDSILCPVCELRVSLSDDYEPAQDTDQETAAMDASADAGRDIAAASTVRRGQEEVPEFDVFLCHNADDKPAVRDLAQKLRDRGLRPWLDENELRPGLPWQPALEEQIKRIPAVAVIVGSRFGPWQDLELAAFLRRSARRGCPVIPVLLPGADRPELPAFLEGMTWVDLAAADPGPDPLERLEWGITGRHPGH
jgi:GTPase SAR1 family protein/nucleotide-binding universal stress UspA family protein